MSLFIGGKDTTPEVDMLREAISIKAGASVSHDRVAEIIGVPADTGRFNSVVQRWRKMVWRDFNIRMVSRDRVFMFLEPNAASDASWRDMRLSGRAIGRMTVRAAAIDVMALSRDRRDRHLLLVRESNALLEATRKSAKVIAAPTAIKSDRLVAER
jgi:hypothetical protein